jgi:prepilin-type N-terminal cleavage/methylation domain-containing protein
MKTRSQGFTLTELLIVIAIIGMLGAIGWPYYQGHVIRARLTEVENAMTVLKSAVTAYHHDLEAFPNCVSAVEIQSSLGVGMLSITRISAITIVNGTIRATVQNIDPLVNGKLLILAPTDDGDGSLRWAWGWSADFPMHLRPRMN